ncbi:BIM1 (YER016W) [Zygosaccharomyces parabailii]|uniref:BN860_02982g1_1 n=1 Tax=Zygosaccharomyces bailii (strain CLIB 213 / ATCC 58445 / CBS 680 / BCRC 21525 / NBRC 1098 / NCYC 1416 / NRRL Y-2227) TaxID=1333698 RepID=A0A8J2X5U4_ZYGB2|nr:BIM1 (YER016W) [Zygosaccharomyces parabailii]CDF88129.1 BN860_02982g1_1 [Zygosaccharomyces bailii CLIB 213]CDH14973.1 related to Protein BIM1 [Zygosaccharomyces bailii ISA1307]SJM87439.1 related to protein BIM1 [Zygosaccharomyces bailii]
MSSIGESRTELLNWLNQLLNLNYKKVEECGTGAAYCQIMDSIYRDIPMHRVKYNATAEYEFQTNFKVLQSCFTRHNIEKTVLVDKLIRCRFQDNLEFLQWLKKYWLQNKDETPYDPDARRKHRPVVSNGQLTGTATGTPGSINVTKRSKNVPSDRRVSSVQLSQAQGQILQLNKEVDAYREAMAVLDRERDFYFGKLRDIEILVQSSQDLINEGVYSTDGAELSKFLSKVQQILYATEEGFEVVEEAKEVPTSDDGGAPEHNLIIDEETF